MAKIYNCPLCSKFYDNRRSLNAHMLKAHYDDYKAHGCSIDAYDDVVDDVVDDVGSVVLRPLALGVEAEKMAYDEGYRFINDADGMCYTVDEAKAKGWL